MKNLNFPRWSGFIISACGIAMMIFGAYRGEMAIVLKKAVKICLECIGIG